MIKDDVLIPINTIPNSQGNVIANMTLFLITLSQTKQKIVSLFIVNNTVSTQQNLMSNFPKKKIHKVKDNINLITNDG